MQRIVLLMVGLSLLIAFAGCANRRPASSIAPRLTLKGFSVDRPPNDNWYLYLSDALQDPSTILYRRDVDIDSTTFKFTIRLADFEHEPESDRQFSKFVRVIFAGDDAPDSPAMISYESRAEPRQGNYCVRVSATYADKSSPEYPWKLFYLKREGLACRHPLRPSAGWIAYYAERSLRARIDDSLAAEGEQILQSVSIDIAARRPGSKAARD